MNALKLPFEFDASKLRSELSQFSEDAYYDIYNPSVTLKTLWSKIFIKVVSQPLTPAVFGPNEALLQCPHMLSIYETFNCAVETFRIHALDAGARIKPHRDSGFSFEKGKVRLHVPIQTNDKVDILLENKRVTMYEGECWYCNFDLLHEVHNRGDRPRVHLIIDCIVNDWLTGVFKDSRD